MAGDRSKRAIILSDLHMGPGNALTTFRDHDALAGFIARISGDSAGESAGESDGSIELIFAGDTFDFLQVDGYAEFDATLAEERFEAIAGNEANRRVLDGIARFAGRPGNEVTLLSGNHDPEMLLPAVRSAFEKAIRRPGTVRYPDDEPLRPRNDEDWPIWGHAIGEGERRTWIVHGDRWDPHNAIEQDRLRACAAAGNDNGKRFELPPGSRLVCELISKLKPDHGWIDELKPEFPAVFLLLLYIEPVKTWDHLRRRWGLHWDLLKGYFEGRLRLGPLFKPEAASVDTARAPVSDLAAWLGQSLGEAAAALPAGSAGSTMADLEEWLQYGPLTGTLARHGGARKLLLRAWLGAVRGLDRFQDLDAPDGIPDGAGQFLPEGVSALVAGHTHGARCHLRGDVRYLNSGTWLPIGRIPPGDLKASIDALDRGERWPAEAPRTFVQVELNGRRPAARLRRCDREGTPRETGHA